MHAGDKKGMQEARAQPLFTLPQICLRFSAVFIDRLTVKDGDALRFANPPFFACTLYPFLCFFIDKHK